jgi:hypothetical protein
MTSATFPDRPSIVTAIDNIGDSRLAGAHRLAIDENGACSAQSFATSVLGADQAEIVP